MNDTTRDLLIRGIAAAKDNDQKQAYFYLEWLLRLEPPMEDRKEAWYWLSKVSTDPNVKRQYIEEILANDLWDPRARRELAILDGKLNPAEVIDSNRVQQTVPSKPKPANGQRFTCPTCGGRMTYTPDGQSLTCEYCDSRQRLKKAVSTEQAGPVENEFITGMATRAGHFRPVTINEIRCQGCGATFILNPEQLSRTCPFCGSAYVLERSTMREIAVPDAIIPFKLDENQARQRLIQWFSGRQFKTRPHVAHGRAVYLPAWCFDVGGSLQLHCQVEINNKWVDHQEQQTVMQQNIRVWAIENIPEGFESLPGSFNLEELAAYDERYLANWLAETYQVSMSNASLEARQQALEIEKQRICGGFEYHYREMRLNSANMQVESYQLLLLPVWTSRYSDGNRQYPLWINGQTGVVFSAEE